MANLTMLYLAMGSPKTISFIITPYLAPIPIPMSSWCEVNGIGSYFC